MNGLLSKSVAQSSKEMVVRGQDMPLGDALDQSYSRAKQTFLGYFSNLESELFDIPL